MLFRLASFLAALALTLAPPAAAQTVSIAVIQPSNCGFFSAASAGGDLVSADTFGRAIDVRRFKSLSAHLWWTSLTGSVDATFKVQVSNDPTAATDPAHAKWVDKNAATFTLSGASGTNSISVGNLNEAYAQFVYTHTGVTGGTLTGYCMAKG